MAWFWATSIVYSYGQIFLSGEQKNHPSLNWLQYVFLCNPITPIAMTFQRAIYGVTQYTYQGKVYHVLPTWGVGTYAALVGVVLAVSVGLFLLALIVFGRLEGNFAEEL